MPIDRRMDGSDPRGIDALAQSVELREDRRAATTRLAHGTLACPECDAPVGLASGPRSPADDLNCPYCGHGGAVRDFLSLAVPSRPARVEVRVINRARRLMR